MHGVIREIVLFVFFPIPVSRIQSKIGLKKKKKKKFE